MSYEAVKLYDIVKRAVHHEWSIPEFQRGFVWKSTQVRDLAESLWLHYPIGSFLLWDSRGAGEPQTAVDAKVPTHWVVDGQQRTTALCILFGRKPYWWNDAEEWNRILSKYDIRFDIEAKEPPYFLVANAAVRATKVPRYIPVRDLLNLDTKKDKDDEQLRKLAAEIKQHGLCKHMDTMEVYVRLDRVRKIRDADVVTITVDHDLEDVVEIFSRLNSKGTRVTEADIYLGVVAARMPGWVREHFLPYLRELTDAGFDISPNLLFRCVTAIGAKKVRFREIDDRFWSAESIQPCWQRTKEAWKNLIAYFRQRGILSSDPMPTEAALVTMVALMDKFPEGPFDLALYWFLQASRFGRYSGSSTTTLSEDLRDIGEAKSLTEAITKLLNRLDHRTPLTAEDFLRDYGDARFGRFLLYLLVYREKALDWDEQSHRIGFEGVQALADFRPQWHHIFPRKFLEGKVSEDKINALANIAVIGPKINIRINARAPMDYISRYNITADKLKAQFIDEDVMHRTVDEYEDWLQTRAQRLAEAANRFLDELKGNADV
ncbi:hypothetical protein GCM10010885_02830 [Alicyclobacillus cellulosilyticus]|uniref:GmrSD restriction endonucleases N-terminal domain-containing protein n=1 Tax=Alicyclobacillus cellulosilyticus TaxID=1003997 RepID=A0A917NGQ1_9BACL|nr:DUF262 domain-containing protein [Alicyclobacillus cellulosilyticus]GGI96524.1 hypothetical protein GCM10010885_02830 [Alicyclobacillus cellulosilyticus]